MMVWGALGLSGASQTDVVIRILVGWRCVLTLLLHCGGRSVRSQIEPIGDRFLLTISHGLILKAWALLSSLRDAKRPSGPSGCASGRRLLRCDVGHKHPSQIPQSGSRRRMSSAASHWLNSTSTKRGSNLRPACPRMKACTSSTAQARL